MCIFTSSCKNINTDKFLTAQLLGQNSCFLSHRYCKIALQKAEIDRHLSPTYFLISLPNLSIIRLIFSKRHDKLVRCFNVHGLNYESLT